MANPGGAPGMPSISKKSAAQIAGAMAHIAWASSEESTIVGSPVRSRWNNAAHTPPASVAPPCRSPNPGLWTAGVSVPNGVSVYATPPRAKYVAASNPPRSRSGPRTPNPVPRAMTIFGLNARMSSTVSRARSGAPGSQLGSNAGEAADDQRASGIPRGDAFHLDHVGAPVGKGDAVPRYVGPRRQLDHS